MVQMTYVNLYCWIGLLLQQLFVEVLSFLGNYVGTDKNAIFYVGVELQNKIKYHDGG